MKKLAYYSVVVLVVCVAVGFGVNAFSGGDAPKNVIEGDYIEASSCEDSLGSLTGPNVYYDMYFHKTVTFNDAVETASTLNATGGLQYRESNVQLTASTTLTSSLSGNTYYIDLASTTIGATVTLPAVSTATGTTFKFIVTDAFSTVNVIVDSAEGDNIYGVLMTGGVDYACSGEDQINFIHDGELPGDFCEVTSDGQQWLIGACEATTDAKLTCTDP